MEKVRKFMTENNVLLQQNICCNLQLNASQNQFYMYSMYKEF